MALWCVYVHCMQGAGISTSAGGKDINFLMFYHILILTYL